MQVLDKVKWKEIRFIEVFEELKFIWLELVFLDGQICSGLKWISGPTDFNLFWLYVVLIFLFN